MFPRKVVWGMPAVIKPIVGAPEGKQRLKLRSREFAKLTVSTADGVRRFLLEDSGAAWVVDVKNEIGRNIRLSGSKGGAR